MSKAITLNFVLFGFMCLLLAGRLFVSAEADNFFKSYPAVPSYRQVDDINPVWAPDGWTLAFERLNKSGLSGQELYSFAPFSKEKRVEPIAVSDRKPMSITAPLGGFSRAFYAGYLCWSSVRQNGSLKYVYAKLPDLYIGIFPILYDLKGNPTVSEKLFISGKEETGIFENKYPAWSADGSKIAFVSGATGNGDIYVKDYGDYQSTSIKSAKRLTYSEGLELYPSWSDDGDQIVYASYKNGNSDLFIIKNLKGSKPSAEVQLTHSTLNETNPVWSADGAKIAFYVLKPKVSELTAEACDLWIVDLEAKIPRLISDNVYRQQKRGATWLPSSPGDLAQNLACIDSNLSSVYIYSIGKTKIKKTQLSGLSGAKYGHITDIACASAPERSYVKNGLVRIPLNIAYSALNQAGEKRIYWDKVDLKTLTVIPDVEYKN